MVTIDWRGEICRLLEIPPEFPNEDVFAAMDSAKKKLHEHEQLRSKALAHQGPPMGRVIHTVHCYNSRAERRLYLDQPWVVESGPFNAHLRGSQPISNLELYLERNREVIFIVYRDYECCQQAPLSNGKNHADMTTNIKETDLLWREHIVLVSPDLRSALTRLTKEISGFSIPHPRLDKEEHVPITHPYLWWYHHRKEVEAVTRKLSNGMERYAKVFQDYLRDRMAEEWTMVDGLLSHGRISRQYMDYLFVST